MTLRGVGVLGMALLATPAEPQTLITPDDFLDAAVGKTLSFHEMSSGELVGEEQFLSPTLSVWRMDGAESNVSMARSVHAKRSDLFSVR